MNSIDPLEGAGAEAPAMIEAVLPGVVQVRRGTPRRGPRGGGRLYLVSGGLRND